MTNVISEYSLEQAIADGILIKIIEKDPVSGKPVIATANLFNHAKTQDLLDLWDLFVAWRRDVMPTLPEVDRMFSFSIEGRKVWVDETPEVVTLMYPEDY